MGSMAFRELANCFASSRRKLHASPEAYGRGGTVGRGRGVGVVLGVGDAIGVGVAVAVAVAVADAAAVAVGVGLAPPPWKLNLPMRVCQLPLTAYSFTCQKDMPSEGSTSVLV